MDKFEFSVDDVKYALDLRMLTPSDDRFCRENTHAGLSVAALLAAFTSGAMGIDYVAILVYLARKQQGEVVSLAEVEKGLTYGSLMEGEMVKADSDKDDEGN